MSKAPLYLHRPGDLPRKELVALANQTIAQYGGPTKCEIHFKFTCSFCGARCSLVEANSLNETGECAVCGETTEIAFGGFALHLKMI